MGDGERCQFVVAQQSRRAATLAALAPAAGRRRGNRGKSLRSRRTSRQIALPIAAKARAAPADIGRIDPGALGESNQETLVTEHMIQHAGEKVGLARGIANCRDVDAGRRNKAESRSGSSAMKESA